LGSVSDQVNSKQRSLLEVERGGAQLARQAVGFGQYFLVGLQVKAVPEYVFLFQYHPFIDRLEGLAVAIAEPHVQYVVSIQDGLPRLEKCPLVESTGQKQFANTDVVYRTLGIELVRIPLRDLSGCEVVPRLRGIALDGRPRNRLRSAAAIDQC